MCFIKNFCCSLHNIYGCNTFLIFLPLCKYYEISLHSHSKITRRKLFCLITNYPLKFSYPSISLKLSISTLYLWPPHVFTFQMFLRGDLIFFTYFCNLCLLMVLFIWFAFNVIISIVGFQFTIFLFPIFFIHSLFHFCSFLPTVLGNNCANSHFNVCSFLINYWIFYVLVLFWDMKCKSLIPPKASLHINKNQTTCASISSCSSFTLLVHSFFYVCNTFTKNCYTFT
jgi:hypothetical protein